MYKILLDDEFYSNLPSYKPYLNGLINFLNEYTDATYIFFHPFGATQSKSPQLAAARTFIEKQILLLRRGEKMDLNEVKDTDDADFSRLALSPSFIGKIYRIKELYPSVQIVIPLTAEKHPKDEKCAKEYVFYINHYAGELNSNIAKWISKNFFVKMPYPSKEDCFPAHSICEDYDRQRSAILQSFKNGSEKSAQFKIIGHEVALRNQYAYSNKLSALNTRKASSERKVYQSNGTCIFYISVDHENGGFELFDKNAKHLGQYKFNGSFEKDSKRKPHILYLK